MGHKTTGSVSIPRSWVLGLGGVVAIGLILGGFGLGVMMHGNAGSPSATTSTTSGTTPTTTGSGGSTTPTTTGSGGTTTPTAGGPFAVGRTVNFHTAVMNLAGQKTTLARGSKGTVIMAMASWCLYCGYEDKWVLPVLAKTPGVTIDIVDVSPQGGIADPGPKSPAFSGHDGTGGPITTATMVSTMNQYKKTFGTLNAANIHIYVAPSATRSTWNIQSTPTLAFVGANGKTAVAPAGAQTISQAQSDLQQAMGR